MKTYSIVKKDASINDIAIPVFIQATLAMTHITELPIEVVQYYLQDMVFNDTAFIFNRAVQFNPNYKHTLNKCGFDLIEVSENDEVTVTPVLDMFPMEVLPKH